MALERCKKKGKGTLSMILDHVKFFCRYVLLPENKFSLIGPIYYEYGSMVLTYENSDDAVQACYTLREATYEERTLQGIN